MTDYDDYENNLAFPPVGDWSDKGEVPTTDRTQSSLDLVDKIAELTKWLNLKSEYICKLEDENKRLKELLKECKRYIDIWGYTDTHGNALLPQINQVLGEE